MAGIKDIAVTGLRKAPLSVVTPLVKRRIRRAQSDPQAVRIARNQMEFLLAASRPDADLDGAAHDHVEHMVWRRELRWHPRTVVRQPVTGLEHLLDAPGPHAGRVLCFLHHGRYDGIFGAIRRAGGPATTTVAADNMFGSGIAPHLRAMKRTAEIGGPVIPVSIGYRGLRDVVASGGTLGIAVDLPGRTRVRFLGRDVGAASGAARIAMETGCPVVLALAHPVGGVHQRLELSEPLLPADHADSTSLVQAMLDRFEPSVLARPDAYEWPRAKFTQYDASGNQVEYERDPGEPEH
jgi:lauroyl/myristoyl acyltransferase